MKTITFLRSSTPDCPEYGYGDHWEVLNDAGQIVGGGHGSTCPNPFKLVNEGQPGERGEAKRILWSELYGMVAEGEYRGLVMMHDKFGLCVLLEDGGKVPSCVPNPMHNGEPYLEQVFVHVGGLHSVNRLWRGSRGCLTIHPDDYPRFCACLGDRLIVRVVVRRMVESL